MIHKLQFKQRVDFKIDETEALEADLAKNPPKPKAPIKVIAKPKKVVSNAGGGPVDFMAELLARRKATE